jgi:hypothetical protein
MATIAENHQASGRGKTTPTVWTGRVLTGLFALFMLGASIAPKLVIIFAPGLLDMSSAADPMTSLGWSPDHLPMIAFFELTFVLLYLYPRTSVLGAVLMTALLGGAMATHIRVGSPLFSHVLFSIYLALFMWGGLWLRSPALRALFPIVSTKD